ncbi:MAG: hypothetical protein NUV76_12810, partial [Candidatus Kuenenia sp.]|nr:hypothetical protein [Candidatus Kuenenia sp.]
MTEVFYKNTLPALKVCKEIPVLTIAFEKSNPQLLFLFLFEEMVVGDFVFLYSIRLESLVYDMRIHCLLCPFNWAQLGLYSI